MYFVIFYTAVFYISSTKMRLKKICASPQSHLYLLHSSLYYDWVQIYYGWLMSLYSLLPPLSVAAAARCFGSRIAV